MPNWCSNYVRFEGERAALEEIREKYFHGRAIELNSVIPMPEILRETQAGSVSGAVKDILAGRYASISRHFPTVGDVPMGKTAEGVLEFLSGTVGETALKEYRHCLQAYRETGFVDWYEWSTQNWGTKWETDGNGDKPDVVPYHDRPGVYFMEAYFDTAWSPPIQVLEALSEKYPQLQIRGAYIDEGGGFAEEFEIDRGVTDAWDVPWNTLGRDVFGWDIEDEKPDEGASSIPQGPVTGLRGETLS